MPDADVPQTDFIIGVDVGGTFTDLVASDGQTLRIVKVPSTPPNFHRGVIDAVSRITPGRPPRIIHGSTVATNALLQRAGHPIAFITTEGFADMLLIGRQNRPHLYALHVQRPPPITEHCFGVPERIDAMGQIVQPLDESALARVIEQIRARNLKHVAVCLLFSFASSVHEQRIADLCRAAGLTVSLSSDLLPEFREYERASTTAINATLRPTVEEYLTALDSGLQSAIRNPQSAIRIIHSSGGTLSPADAAAQAVRLVLSGPAGGILGAAYVARLAGFNDLITYDMGGTSTDVATILGGAPQWTTNSTIDGLPIALPMFDIHTVGAGGGSIAYLDPGGALRVGPRSAGANPGPACYDRGGVEPTVTDANLLLGRIRPEHFLGGEMVIRKDLAQRALAKLAARLGKSELETALGILKVAQSNMQAAIRAVTSRRGHDPRRFTLVSFGGAGGLHACAIADALDIPRVLIPPYAGVLSALGMVVAPPVAEASKTVVQLGDELDDPRLAAEFGQISGRTMETIPYDQTSAVEVFADARFKGQSHELTVRITRPARDHIGEEFRRAYQNVYGHTPTNKSIEIATLRVRRLGHAADVTLPTLRSTGAPPVSDSQASLTLDDGRESPTRVLTRSSLLDLGPTTGPLLLIDPEATAYVPPHWRATGNENGAVVLTPLRTS
jgi:N-methylhydantoinase A